MTVQEAIKHCEEKAKEKYAEGMLCHANPNDDLLDGCIKCAKEHEQLAEWLKELQQYRELGTVEELKEAREKQINIGLALDLAWRYGQVDGSHHKMWVIDQMVRSLCGNEEEYKKWVSKYTEPQEDDDYYEWDCGIAP